VKEKIIALIKELGPIVPSEITGRLESSSVIISALISELIKEGRVFYSHKKIGNSPVYYVTGQEESVRKRLLPELNIAEKKIVEFFENNKLVLKDNLSPQQRYMVDELRDFIKPLTLNINGVDKVFYKHYSIPTQSIYDELKKRKVKKVKPEKSPVPQSRLFDEPKPKEYTPKSERVEPKFSYKKFDDLSEQFFTQYNLTVLDSKIVRKNTEANFTVLADYRIKQKYFVKYFKKKTVNEKDISKAQTAAQLKKMPCLIITTGKLSKKGKKLMKGLGSYINVIKL
jgi:hypothetical protein